MRIRDMLSLLPDSIGLPISISFINNGRYINNVFEITKDLLIF